MCDFATFRSNARAAFSSLIVSVMMYEKGNGKGGEVTMFRLKVAGMAIGDDLTAQGDSGTEVIASMARKVAAARKAKQDADLARALARRAAATGGQTVQMVIRAEASEPQALPELKIAA